MLYVADDLEARNDGIDTVEDIMRVTGVLLSQDDFYGEKVEVLDIEIADNGSLSGRFRNVSNNRVFQFKINGEDVSYRPYLRNRRKDSTEHKAMLQWVKALMPVERTDAKFSKKCKDKSYRCGNTCISILHECHVKAGEGDRSKRKSKTANLRGKRLQKLQARAAAVKKEAPELSKVLSKKAADVKRQRDMRANEKWKQRKAARKTGDRPVYEKVKGPSKQREQFVEKVAKTEAEIKNKDAARKILKERRTKESNAVQGLRDKHANAKSPAEKRAILKEITAQKKRDKEANIAAGKKAVEKRQENGTTQNLGKKGVLSIEDILKEREKKENNNKGKTELEKLSQLKKEIDEANLSPVQKTILETVYKNTKEDIETKKSKKKKYEPSINQILENSPEIVPEKKDFDVIVYPYYSEGKESIKTFKVKGKVYDNRVGVAEAPIPSDLPEHFQSTSYKVYNVNNGQSLRTLKTEEDAEVSAEEIAILAKHINVDLQDSKSLEYVASSVISDNRAYPGFGDLGLAKNYVKEYAENKKITQKNSRQKANIKTGKKTVEKRKAEKAETTDKTSKQKANIEAGKKAVEDRKKSETQKSGADKEYAKKMRARSEAQSKMSQDERVLMNVRKNTETLLRDATEAANKGDMETAQRFLEDRKINLEEVKRIEEKVQSGKISLENLETFQDKKYEFMYPSESSGVSSKKLSPKAEAGKKAVEERQKEKGEEKIEEKLTKRSKYQQEDDAFNLGIPMDRDSDKKGKDDIAYLESLGVKLTQSEKNNIASTDGRVFQKAFFDVVDNNMPKFIKKHDELSFKRVEEEAILHELEKEKKTIEDRLKKSRGSRRNRSKQSIERLNLLNNANWQLDLEIEESKNVLQYLRQEQFELPIQGLDGVESNYREAIRKKRAEYGFSPLSEAEIEAKRNVDNAKKIIEERRAKRDVDDTKKIIEGGETKEEQEKSDRLSEPFRSRTREEYAQKELDELPTKEVEQYLTQARADIERLRGRQLNNNDNKAVTLRAVELKNRKHRELQEDRDRVAREKQTQIEKEANLKIAEKALPKERIASAAKGNTTTSKESMQLVINDKKKRSQKVESKMTDVQKEYQTELADSVYQSVKKGVRQESVDDYVHLLDNGVMVKTKAFVPKGQKEGSFIATPNPVWDKEKYNKSTNMYEFTTSKGYSVIHEKSGFKAFGGKKDEALAAAFFLNKGSDLTAQDILNFQQGNMSQLEKDGKLKDIGEILNVQSLRYGTYFDDSSRMPETIQQAIADTPIKESFLDKKDIARYGEEIAQKLAGNSKKSVVRNEYPVKEDYWRGQESTPVETQTIPGKDAVIERDLFGNEKVIEPAVPESQREVIKLPELKDGKDYSKGSSIYNKVAEASESEKALKDKGVTKTQQQFIAQQVLQEMRSGRIVPDSATENTNAAVPNLVIDIPGTGGTYSIPRTPYAINNFLKGMGIRPKNIEELASKLKFDSYFSDRFPLTRYFEFYEPPSQSDRSRFYRQNNIIKLGKDARANCRAIAKQVRGY